VLQIPAYRVAAALCCRDWFAADVCCHSDLSELLLDARRGTGAMCKWRFAVVLVIGHITKLAHERSAGSAAAAISGFGACLAEHASVWADAVRKGLYGADTEQGAPLPDVAQQAA
jgi:hypothetical protein